MAKGFFYDDDEDEDDGTPPLHPRTIRTADDEDETAAGTIPPYSFAPADSFDTRSYVGALFRTPLFGAPQHDGAQNNPAPPVDSSRPRSWKLPGTNIASPAIPGADTASDDGPRTILGDDTAAGARLAEPDSQRPAGPPPPVAFPPLRSAAEVPNAPSISPAPSLDPGVEAIAAATGINRNLLGAAFDLAKTWFGSLVPDNARTRPLGDARPEPAQQRSEQQPPQQENQPAGTNASRSFGEEAIDEVRKRRVAGAPRGTYIIDAIADVAVRRDEISAKSADYLWAKLALDGPEDVRFAAARAIVRVLREAPTARARFEPWQVESAEKVVQLAETELDEIDPSDPAYDEKRRDILRRVNVETANIFPPGTAALMAGGLAAKYRSTRGIDRAKRASILEQNKKNGGFSDLEVGKWLRRSLRDYAVKVIPQKTEKTSKGLTRPDDRISKEATDKRIKSVEVKDGDARWPKAQREKQLEIETSLARNYRDEGKIYVDDKPGSVWMKGFKRGLDRLGLRRVKR